MHWENGWPVIGVDINRNGIGEPVAVWTKPRVAVQSDITSPQTDDDFDAGRLGLQWQFNHNPVDSAWSLSERKGMLTLQALKADDFRSARNTVTQKTVGYKGCATVKMDFSRMADGQRCGLACMGARNNVLGVKKEHGKVMLYFEADGKIVETYAVSGKTVYLRLNADATANDYAFSYSKDGRKFVQAGDAFTMEFGNWKGIRVGLYCYNADAGGGVVSFDNFTYSHDGPGSTAGLKGE